MVSSEEHLDPVYLARLLKGLKQEIRMLKDEFHRMEGEILKGRLRAVEDALSQNRLLLYADQLDEELKEDIQRLLNIDCENREECTERYTNYLADILKLIKNLEVKEAFADLNARINQMEQTVEEAEGMMCEPCLRNVCKKLRKEKKVFQTITLVEDRWEEDEPNQFDIPFLVESLLEPLANSKRLSILISLHEGKKSFSKLSELTGLKGGHLSFHLKKLLNAQLIAQEENKGDYIITQRGIEAAKRILSMSPRG